MPEQTTPNQAKQWWKAALRAVVSIGLLTYLFYKVGIGNIIETIRGADPFMVAMIFVVMFAEHVHGTYKWLILLRHTSSNIPFWPLLRVRYLSAFIGIFGLGAVTIELVRMYGLARYTRDLAMSFTSILMDRLLGLTGLALMVLFGVFMETRAKVGGIEYWAAAALIAMIAGWVAIMNPAFRRFTDKLLSPRWLSMVRDKQRKVYASLDVYRGRPGLLAWGMVQSIVFNVLRIMVVWVGALAVGIDVPVTAYFVVVPAVIFAMLLPISMSGWGVREAMFAALLPMYGADRETVLAMSVLIGICSVLSTLPGAVILMTGLGAPKTDDNALVESR
ncbi:MAG: lysylphosphatidylglycerol synthase transmembrane domain-containing protein [Phycisphaeraceae bacterium]